MQTSYKGIQTHYVSSCLNYSRSSCKQTPFRNSRKRPHGETLEGGVINNS